MKCFFKYWDDSILNDLGHPATRFMDSEGVWLGGVVAFFQRYNTFNHKPHLTTPPKAIKTCFLLKKKAQATSPPIMFNNYVF